MWNKPAVTITALLFALAGFIWIAIDKINAPKYGFVRIKDVFEKFDMKKEVEMKFQHENGTRQRLLDSMAFVLQRDGGQLQQMDKPADSLVENFTFRKNDYLERKQQFDQDKQSMTENYNTQIVTRMSQYIRDYGQENGYTYVFGDDGNGSILFAKDAQDLTTPVIAYINQRYAGQKK